MTQLQLPSIDEILGLQPEPPRPAPPQAPASPQAEGGLPSIDDILSQFGDVPSIPAAPPLAQGGAPQGTDALPGGGAQQQPLGPFDPFEGRGDRFGPPIEAERVPVSEEEAAAFDARIQTEKDRKERIAALPTSQRIVEAFVAFDRSILEGAGSGLQFLAQTKKELQLAQPDGANLYTEEDKEIRDFRLWKWGKAIKKFAKANYPQDPDLAQSFVEGVLPSAAGDMALFAGAGVAGRALKLGKIASGALAATTGAALESVPAFEEAKALGFDDEDALVIARLGAAIGATEVVPINRAFNRFDKASGGVISKSIRKTVARWTKEGVKGGAEELIQESFQTVMSNALSQEILLKEGDLFDGLVEAGGAGGILGFAMSFIASAAGGRRRGRRGKPTPEAPIDVAPTAAEPTLADVTPRPGVSEVVPDVGADTKARLLTPEGATEFAQREPTAAQAIADEAKPTRRGAFSRLAEIAPELKGVDFSAEERVQVADNLRAALAAQAEADAAIDELGKTVTQEKADEKPDVRDVREEERGEPPEGASVLPGVPRSVAQKHVGVDQATPESVTPSITKETEDVTTRAQEPPGPRIDEEGVRQEGVAEAVAKEAEAAAEEVGARETQEEKLAALAKIKDKAARRKKSRPRKKDLVRPGIGTARKKVAALFDARKDEIAPEAVEDLIDSEPLLEGLSAGMTFQDTKAGRDTAKQILDALPSSFGRRPGFIRFIERGAPGFGDAMTDDFLARVAERAETAGSKAFSAVDIIARSIERESLGRGESSKADAAAAFIIENPRQFTPDDLFDAKNYLAIRDGEGPLSREDFDVDLLGEEVAKPAKPAPSRGLTKAAQARKDEKAFAESAAKVFQAPLEAAKPGTKPISNHEVIATISDDFKIPVRRGRIASRKAAGIFKFKPEIVRVKGKFAGDVAVVSHEVAHFIDKTESPYAGVPVAMREELSALDYEPDKGRIGEGFAEFYRHLLSEDDAQVVAPEFYEFFVNKWLPAHPDIQAKTLKHKKLINQLKAQGALARAQANISKTGKAPRPLGVPMTSRLSQRVLSAVDRVYTAMKAEAHPLAKFVKEARRRGLKRRVGETSIEMQMAFSQSGPTFAQAALEDGVFTLTGKSKKIGPSFRDVFKDIEPAEYDNFVTFAWARHAIESHSLGKHPGMSLADAKFITQKLINDRFTKAADMLRDFNDGLINMLADAGVITQEEADRITSFYKTYVPLLRVRDDSVLRPLGRGYQSQVVDLPTPIRGRVGSDLQIMDPVMATAERAIRFYTRASQQLVQEAMIKEAEEVEGLGGYIEPIPPSMKPVKVSMEQVRSELAKLGVEEESLQDIDPETLLTIWKPDFNTQGRKPIARILGPDGETRLFEFDPALYRAITNMRQPVFGALTEIFGAGTRLLKLGATGLNPDFALRNTLRDQFTFLFQKKHGKDATAPLTPMQMIATYVWSEGQVVLGKKGDEIVRLWQKNGGELAPLLGLDRNRNSIRKTVRDAVDSSAKRKALNIITDPIEAMRTVVNVSEVGPRLAEFKAFLKEHGWTARRLREEGPPPRNLLVGAINASNDVTTNFKRMGHVGRQINMILPFFNAALEGGDKFVRTWRDRPKRAFVMSVIGVAGTLAYWLNRKDDDDYKTMPDWLKYGFWTITDENGKPIWRIPVPFEWGWVVKSGTEAILNGIEEHQPQLLLDYVKEAARALNPVTTPSVITPFAEAYFNYDLFRQRPIFDDRFAKVQKRDQFAPYNTVLMRKIGDIVNQSPAKMEHVLEGLSGGGFGRLVKPIERGFGLRPKEKTETPFIGGIRLRKDFSKDVDEFFDTRDKLDRRRNSAKLRGDVPQALADEQAIMGDYARLMSKLRKNVRLATGRDARFKAGESSIIGLARFALGKNELDRFPNPLNTTKAPQKVQEIADKFLAGQLIASVSTSKTATKINSRRQALQVLGGLSISNDRAVELVRRYAPKNWSRRVRKNKKLTAMGRTLFALRSR